MDCFVLGRTAAFFNETLVANNRELASALGKKLIEETLCQLVIYIYHQIMWMS